MHTFFLDERLCPHASDFSVDMGPALSRGIGQARRLRLYDVPGLTWLGQVYEHGGLINDDDIDSGEA